MDRGEIVELEIDKLVAGGAGLARSSDGRVVLVDGCLPGERVAVVIERVKRDVAFGRAVQALRASPDRVIPPCAHVADGCGGCDWQHIATHAQGSLKRTIVADALVRLGAFADPPVLPTVELPALRYRQRVRFVVTNGRAAFRRAGSNDPIAVTSCAVLHPKLDRVMTTTDWSASREAELAYGTATDETLRVAPTERSRARSGQYHEIVAGHRFRISARSFFQIRTDGAEVLVDLVRRAVGDVETLADLYAGVGLFAATVPTPHVVAIEGNPDAVADCRVNLAPHPDAKVHRIAVERWRAKRSYEGVVADPSRAGLGLGGVASVLRCRPRRIALVSCDPAAMARDVRALAQGGYELAAVTPVDLFPMTSHIETVASLVRR
jgi:23S rRNA (uracil1939-C5)-methyltransferase